MIRAVIFDFDDTLVHTFQNGFTDLKMLSERIGLEPPSMDDVRRNWGKSVREFVKTLWPKARFSDFLKARRGEDILRSCPPVRGVHEAIDILGSKYIIGIVTGSNRSHFMRRAVEAKLNLSKFSFIFTADEIKQPKSDPGFFNTAYEELGKLGIGREEVLFVGDSVYDLGAALNAGIHFAGVLTGPARKEDFMSAGLRERFIAPSVMELPLLIERNGF